jgi:large subunit ribosomal protein L6
MSRIGKQIIKIPSSIEIKILKNEVLVKGPKGELKQELPPFIKVEIDGQDLTLKVEDQENKKQKSLWGTMNRLIANMIKGVTEGFEKKLEMVGVGYRAEVNQNNLILRIGYSHPVDFSIPEGIDVQVEKNIITIKGINKQMVGDTAARIRRLRKPEPYKGKGLKYVDEVIRRKAGKKTATAGDKV